MLFRSMFSNEQTAFIVQHKPSFFRAPASSQVFTWSPGTADPVSSSSFDRRRAVTSNPQGSAAREIPIPPFSQIPTVTKTCQGARLFGLLPDSFRPPPAPRMPRPMPPCHLGRAPDWPGRAAFEPELSALPPRKSGEEAVRAST